MFLFNNLQAYHGFTDGEVDDDGDFCIMREGLMKGVKGIAMPFNRLVGWKYIEQDLFAKD